MKPTELSRSSGRKVYLEAARILAAFFVIFNHTGASGFFLFAQRPWGSAAFWVYLFFSVTCCMSVPLFFMISGALMLHRDNESLGRLWKARIGKNVLIILLFGLGNYALDLMAAPERADFRWMLRCILTGNLNGATFWYGHLWFLYAYIAYLCCLPFLRALVKDLEDRYFLYLIAIVLTVKALIPAAEFLLAEDTLRISRNLLPQWLTADILVYPCVGYYLEHRVDIRKQKKKIPLLWAAAFAGTGITGILIYRKALLTGVLEESSAQTFHSMFIMLTCIAVYVTLKYLFTQVRIPASVEKSVLSVGGCTFGIYLIHIMVMDLAPMRNLLRFLLDRGVNNLAASFIQCGCVFAVSCCITAVARKIPVLGKLLG